MKLTLLLLLSPLLCLSQFTASVGVGQTNGLLSSDLQVGARVNNIIITAGYLSITRNDQPVHFGIRAGYELNRSHIYVGVCRTVFSTDDKTRNNNALQVGYNHRLWSIGNSCIFIGACYTTKQYISLHVGMRYN